MTNRKGNPVSTKKAILPIPQNSIESHIFLIRGQKVLMDEDLATLYEVETKALNRAVKRNLDRFPEDFMFQLTADEFSGLGYPSGTSNLRSQNGTSSWGGRRYLPYAFTEQGVAMLSSVLRSKRSVRFRSTSKSCGLLFDSAGCSLHMQTLPESLQPWKKI